MRPLRIPGAAWSSIGLTGPSSSGGKRSGSRWPRADAMPWLVSLDAAITRGTPGPIASGRLRLPVTLTRHAALSAWRGTGRPVGLPGAGAAPDADAARGGRPPVCAVGPVATAPGPACRRPGWCGSSRRVTLTTPEHGPAAAALVDVGRAAGPAPSRAGGSHGLRPRRTPLDIAAFSMLAAAAPSAGVWTNPVRPVMVARPSCRGSGRDAAVAADGAGG